MTDYLVTTTWKDDQGREASTKNFVALSAPNPDDAAAEDFFAALQAASTASLIGYSTRQHITMSVIGSAVASPYSVRDKAVLSFRAVEGQETVRYSISVPKNAVFTDDELLKSDQSDIAALITWLETHARTVSGFGVRFTGGWRQR